MNFDNSFGRKSICLLMFLTIMITGTTAGFAQFDTAVVLGTVKDQNGAVLRGANITLKNNATGITATTQTDSNGDYIFPSVKIGTY
jgi:protocatechuate 3,4-dioxygenase beta subunit